jgi:cytosine/adenosine deaminase-related metal-dependent hydrolase
VPPARAFREAGGLVALGSDQACGNNCNNIFNEMKLTALFNKIQARDPTVFPAWEVLRMVTIEGAQAYLHVPVQAGDEVGSLEPGKQADLMRRRQRRHRFDSRRWTRSGYRMQSPKWLRNPPPARRKRMNQDEDRS